VEVAHRVVARHRFAAQRLDLLADLDRRVFVGAAPVERHADVVDDDPRSLTPEAQCELSADAPARPGDDRDATVEQTHRQEPTAAVAAPVMACSSFWFATVMSTSTRCSPFSSRLPVTSAVHVSTSPGHTCFAKRTCRRRMASGPNQSFTTRAASPIDSMP